MNLLIFNLATDADDPVLGFTTAWLRALAEHCDHIYVITVRQGRLDLPGNVSVYSVGKEKGYSKPRKALEFYRHLGRILSSERVDACFAHMQPRFAVLGAPLLKIKCIPITLWYTHRSVTWLLRLAEKLVDQIVTASPESFRIPSDKVTVTGHGIDTDVFVPALGVRPVNYPFTVVSIGRLSPIKHLEILIEATHILVHKLRLRDLQVRLVGHTYPRDIAYAEGLRQQVAEHDLAGIVRFIGPVPFKKVVGEYQQADVTVNLCPTGGVDKAVLEAMSCGVLTVVTNETFRSILGQWVDTLLVPNNPVDLAIRLHDLALRSPTESLELGQRLRRVVVEGHSLQELARRLAIEILPNRKASLMS